MYGLYYGFPNALDDNVQQEGYLRYVPIVHGRELELTLLSSNLVTHREVLMMRVINNITDKPQWDQKVCVRACVYIL